MDTTKIFIGMMSGTSLDGIDAVAVDLAPPVPHVLGYRHAPWANFLMGALLRAAEGSPFTMAEIARLNRDVSEAHVDLVEGLLADVDRHRVRAIGMHGQTVWHHPPDSDGSGFGLQLGSPSWVAARTEIPVVGDFRTADMALGGQGAPLAPYAHHRLFHHPKEIRGILNLGGIANLTVLTPGQPIWASDTGPANMLMDDVARHFSQGRVHYDADGMHAAEGQCQVDHFNQMIADPFFSQPFPKSTGRERFGRIFSARLDGLSWADASHTAGQLTVWSVAQAIKALPRPLDRLIVAGGGAYNGWLLSRLALALDPISVHSTEVHGINPMHLEAIAFAILAEARLDHLPANLPQVTGAISPVLLGTVAGIPSGR